MAWFSNNVHPSFTHISRPERFATDTKVFDHLKEVGRSNFHNCLKEIDGIIGGKPWILGDQFSVVDCYALVFYGWGKRIGLPVEELKNYSAWEDRMLARPAWRVLEREQNVLVAAAGAQPTTKLGTKRRSWVSCGDLAVSTRASRPGACADLHRRAQAQQHHETARAARARGRGDSRTDAAIGLPAPGRRGHGSRAPERRQ
jgi:hypothetical protein